MNTTKVSIKLGRTHPSGFMMLSKYAITNEEQVLELTDEELKELDLDGPKFWFKFEILGQVEAKPVSKKKVAKKKTAKKKVVKKNDNKED
jgi:hypothetical protein